MPTVSSHWLVVVTGLIEPEVIGGPYATDEEQIEAAKAIVRSNKYGLGEEGEDALFWLDITTRGFPVMGAFDGQFMDVARGSS